MEEHHLTDEQIMELSKQNPKEIYTCDDGRIIVNGVMFKNKAEMERMIKLYTKFKKIKNFFKRI
jgi:hypothetical protein